MIKVSSTNRAVAYKHLKTLIKVLKTSTSLKNVTLQSV